MTSSDANKIKPIGTGGPEDYPAVITQDAVEAAARREALRSAALRGAVAPEIGAHVLTSRSIEIDTSDADEETPVEVRQLKPGDFGYSAVNQHIVAPQLLTRTKEEE